MIKEYEKRMLKNILKSKSAAEVIDIVDYKINLIKNKAPEQSTLNRFLNGSLTILKDTRSNTKQPQRLSKLRIAICHILSLKMINKS